MKVLVFGDSEGDYVRTLKKASLLAKKQKFDCLLCLGDLFTRETDDASLQELLQDSLVVDIPTYFVEGPAGLPEAITNQAALHSDQICTNLFLLGASGLLSLAEGARLAFHTRENEDKLHELLQKPSPVDILLTSLGSSPTTSNLVSNQAKQALLALMPKYHFFCSTVFREDKPYSTTLRNGGTRLTREISLASVANDQKSKWFYAFNLSNTPPTAEALSSAVPNPYLAALDTKRKRDAVQPDEKAAKSHTPVDSSLVEHNGTPNGNRKVDTKRPPLGYVCKLCSQADEHYYKDCPSSLQSKKRKRPKSDTTATTQKHVDPETCFFCLSNPILARHLIVSIGDAGSYLALPKGAMTQNHVLIIPVDHKPTLKALADSRQTVESEMTKYIKAIEVMYQTLSLTGVVFEISRSTGVHLHYQMIPVPFDKVNDLMDAFLAFAESEKIVLEHRAPTAEDEDYFRVEFPSKGAVLTGTLGDRKRFDLQFGRRVIADVMGVPQRAHWKDCIRTDQQEAMDAESFKKVFRPFDFSL